MKTCRKCNETKDESCFLFRVDSGKLRNECRDCVKKMMKAYKDKMSVTAKIEVESKKCLECSVVKKASEFTRNRYAVDGRTPYCRSCNNARTHKYRIDHPEIIRESARRSIAKNRVKIANQQKVYRSSPEHKAKKKAWYEANKHWYCPYLQDKHKSKMLSDSKYRDSFKVWMRDAASKRRSLQLMTTYIKMNKSGQELLMMKADWKCLKCESELNLCIDHVMPISKGGSSAITNYQPLCKSCNSSKHAKFVDYRPWTMDSDEIGLDTNCYAH